LAYIQSFSKRVYQTGLRTTAICKGSFVVDCHRDSTVEHMHVPTLPHALQGSTVLWHPQWLEFPELAVRCDVVIKGPRLDDALGLLAELLTSDLQELEAVPVYFVEGLRFAEPHGGSP
jgi:hypothetical protein